MVSYIHMGTKNKRPLISIITCTLNSEKYLKENIKSVGEQSFKDFEHIFIDGYSSDRTLKIIGQYKKGKNNIHLHKQKPTGISSAMNAGIMKAKGDYIMHLHSDDKLASKVSLKREAVLAKRENCPDMLIGKIIEINAEGKALGKFPPAWIFNLPDNFLNFVNFIPHQGVIMKRSIFLRYDKFDSKYKYCMDYDLWLRVYKDIRKIFLDYPISKYRVHDLANSFNKAHTEKIREEYKKVQFSYSPKMLHGIISIFDEIIQTYVFLKRSYQKWRSA